MPDQKPQEAEPKEPFISAGKDIDVDQIMTAIQTRIQEKKDSGILRQKEIDEIDDMELLPQPDFLEVPNVFQNHLYPEHSFDEFKPFHVEQESETGTAKKIMAKGRGLFMPLLRFLLRPFLTDIKNLFVELHNRNKKDIHEFKPYIPIVQQSKEYIKLLHNSANNITVEISKMKIEEEMLKTRLKVLEDKIRFLEERERAIEKKVFPAGDETDTPAPKEKSKAESKPKSKSKAKTKAKTKDA